MAQIQAQVQGRPFFTVGYQGRQPGGHLNYLQIQLGTHQKKDKGLPKRGNSTGNSVEMRNGRVEDMHGSQLVLDKALGENSGK